MAKLLLLCVANVVFALDFLLEVDYIYKLESKNFFIKDGVAIIEKSFISGALTQLNSQLHTMKSKWVFEENLQYFYHTQRFKELRENLIELTSNSEHYRAQVPYTNYRECFVIIKHHATQNLKAKNSAILVNLNNLDSQNAAQKFYFHCNVEN